ncbi:uncharacterized protein LOC125237172 [Leguminivora glycinivorella]|uniref:uncharacterized protein LOC125237172 n=1 Tax=Leguminivora glycinivorella TaxID=1035111 RepID=UPI00200DC862|nr:uncharacterized protein LOC125237172 [Leguminivora glycinivorella]
MTSEVMKSTEDVQDSVMQTLDKEDAPMAAKVLVAQVLSQKLSDATKEEIKKQLSPLQIPYIEDDSISKGPEDDEATLNDDNGSGMVHNGLGSGSKKQMCIFTPVTKLYCVSQMKEL